MTLGDKCSGHKDRKSMPDGYIARSEWFEEMSKTHKQKRCKVCKLWAIWVPKKKRVRSKK